MTRGVWVIDGNEYPGIDRPRFDGKLTLEFRSPAARAAVTYR
jgi:hypothetical protein